MSSEKHVVLESWEDEDDEAFTEQVDAKVEPGQDQVLKESLWHPAPHEFEDEGLTSAGKWSLAYTLHPGRFEVEDAVVHSDLRELLSDAAGRKLRAALVTSFLPFNPGFLRKFPQDVHLTVCVQDKMRGEKRALPKHFFGIELHDVKQHRSSVLANSSFCTACFPQDNPRRCSPNQYVRACQCPERFFRRVQWVFPQLQGDDIMHAKVMALRFEGFVRLVVSSFNLSDDQWHGAGDSFWWVDLPFRHEPTYDDRVMQPLMDLLYKLEVPECWRSLLSWCDCCSLQQANTNVHMITSVPRDSCNGVKYGMERLGDVLRRLPQFPYSGTCPVYVQVWSLGSANDSWYTDFAVKLTNQKFRDLGLLAQWEYDHVRFIWQRCGKGPNWHRHFKQQNQEENMIRAFFDLPERPTKRSELQQALWDEKDAALLRPMDDCQSVPWGWHSKVMTREYPANFCKRVGCTRKHGWRYIGSHNCSRASWGWNYYDPIQQEWVMDPAHNYEAGVLLVSQPARSNSECGVDLDQCAPLPFRLSSLFKTSPSY